MLSLRRTVEQSVSCLKKRSSGAYGKQPFVTDAPLDIIMVADYFPYQENRAGEF